MTDWTFTLPSADVADALSLADVFNDAAMTSQEKVARVLTHATNKLAENMEALCDQNGAYIVHRHCPSSGHSYAEAIFHARQAVDLVTRPHPQSNGEKMRIRLSDKTLRQLIDIRRAFKLNESHGAARLALRVATAIRAEKRNPGKHEDKPVKLIPGFDLG